VQDTSGRGLGYPPALKISQDWGYRGFIETISAFLLYDAIEKEVQDASCRGSGGCPPDLKIPQDWVSRGLIETISAFSILTMRRQ
jgi:hypothetical protein